MAAGFRWSVGVTTAPRAFSTLEISLQSMARAGWQSPRLFAEPDSSLLELASQLRITQRDEPLGAFSNWYMALTELAFRDPHADAYLICQDDVLYSAGLRAYLEQTLWPEPAIGVVSVYCPSHEHQHDSWCYKAIDPGWNAWGALACIFSNPGVRQFLSDARVLNHRFEGPAGGDRNIDSVIGRFCRESKLPYFVHTPSLAQHIGRTSTIWRRGAAIGRRRAVGAPARLGTHSAHDAPAGLVTEYSREQAEIEVDRRRHSPNAGARVHE